MSEKLKIHLFDQRFYYDEETNLFFPSVTTIISETLRSKGIEQWLKSVGFNSDVVSELAMQRGSRVHEGIERVLKGDTLQYGDMESDEYLLVSKAIEFVNSLKFGKMFIEQNAHREDNGIKYAGTLDLLIYIKEGAFVKNRKEIPLEEGWYILDWKTGGAYNIPHSLQLGAYSRLAEILLKGKKVVGALDVYLEAKNKAGIGFNFLNAEDLDYWYGMFLKVADIYNEFYRIPEPTLVELKKKIQLEA